MCEEASAFSGASPSIYKHTQVSTQTTIMTDADNGATNNAIKKERDVQMITGSESEEY